jgi:hypothetical protein
LQHGNVLYRCKQATASFHALEHLNSLQVIVRPFFWIALVSPQSSFLERAPVAILSFQASAQLITKQVLGLAEIPTVVLTSVNTGLASDFHFFDKVNIHENGRVAAMVLQFCGAIANGWLARSGATISTALWISVAIKAGIAISWMFWREEERSPRQ